MFVYNNGIQKELSQKDIQQLLDYDPETGILTWKERSSEWFKPTARRTSAHLCNLWNSNNAGNKAFTSGNGEGYLSGSIDSNRVKAHRVAWFWMHGEWPEQIDHDNGIRSDNRIENLFDRSQLENARNQKLHITNTSGYAGVHKRKTLKTDKPYQARIYIDGKRVSLGYGETPEIAYAIRKAKEEELGYNKLHGTDKQIHYRKYK